MDLYFSPLACSLGSRIALYEAGADARFYRVDSRQKRVVDDGADYLKINPLGLVPALRTEAGDVLTENAAILQFIAARFPEAALAPTDALGRTRMQQWLCFIGMELHKSLFVPLLDEKAPEEVKRYALDKQISRLDYLASHLANREFLLDRFSVADGYLAAVLGWSIATSLELEQWPALTAYLARLRQRPSVAKAWAEERALYAEELERRAKV
jgi:glutathione S-transferase